MSANTISRLSRDIGNNIVRQLKDTVRSFKCFSIALDESTDSSDSAQVLLIIRGVIKTFEIIEELAAVYSMQDTYTGNEIILKVKESLFGLRLDFNILKGITTDGEYNMFGTH